MVLLFLNGSFGGGEEGGEEGEKGGQEADEEVGQRRGGREEERRDERGRGGIRPQGCQRWAACWRKAARKRTDFMTLWPTHRSAQDV